MSIQKDPSEAKKLLAAAMVQPPKGVGSGDYPAEQLRRMIQDPEMRKLIASHMVSPVRCGGCDYDPDGSRWYYVGGKRIREADFKALQNRSSRS
jgi:hypothetical protein